MAPSSMRASNHPFDPRKGRRGKGGLAHGVVFGKLLVNCEDVQSFDLSGLLELHTFHPASWDPLVVLYLGSSMFS